MADKQTTKGEAKVEAKGGVDDVAAPPAPEPVKSKLDDGKKHTVEELAADAGLFPEFTPTPAPAHRPGAQLPATHNPKFAVFARAKVWHKWPLLMELTKPEFDDAIAASEKAAEYR